MDDERFDAIVVGAGLAGSAAAYRMAKAGLSVLLVERGEEVGAKNMTGGRIYTHTLEKLIPEFREDAPLERRVKKERISVLENGTATNVEYVRGKEDAEGESYTVLRARLDPWLASKAEEEGAMLISGIQASELLMKDGKVEGVRCGEDELFADVVILADGVNSLLAETAGLRKPVQPSQVAVGAKDVFELDEKTINDRFGLDENDGLACLMLGDITHGIMGGGFLYTNKTSISLGIVVGLEHIGESEKNIEEMLVELEEHPAISVLIKDAKLIERSGHMVPEAGLKGMSTLSGAGFLIVGDAAGLCMNLGFTVRGMDLAIQSGICAADTVIECVGKKSFTAQDLAKYDSQLMGTPCGMDLKLYKDMPTFMETDRIFKDYPAFVNGLMYDVFTVTGKGEEPLFKKMMRHVNKVGVLNLAKDGWKGVRSL